MQEQVYKSAIEQINNKIALTNMGRGLESNQDTTDDCAAIAERLGGAVITLDRRNWRLMFGNTMLGNRQYDSNRQFIRVQDPNTLGVHLYEAETGEYLGILPRY